LELHQVQREEGDLEEEMEDWTVWGINKAAERMNEGTVERTREGWHVM